MKQGSGQEGSGKDASVKAVLFLLFSLGKEV
jgi:hypothetical protein